MESGKSRIISCMETYNLNLDLIRIKMITRITFFVICSKNIYRLLYNFNYIILEKSQQLLLQLYEKWRTDNPDKLKSAFNNISSVIKLDLLDGESLGY